MADPKNQTESSSSQNIALQNSNDPLFLHPSDHPGLSLVTDVFAGENFGEWKISMHIGISAKNKMCFITGSLPCPKKEDPTYDRWQRCNDMVRSWLLNGLNREIRRSVIYTATAQGIWEELNIRFGQLSGAQLYAVKKELSSLTQGSDSISTYYTKMKILWDELNSLKRMPLCTCGATKELVKYDEDERLIHFLMGLNDVYTGIRGSILLLSPLPSIAQGYAMALQEEKQRESKGGSDVAGESATMNASTNRVGSQSQSSKSGERKELYCTNCKKTNHTVDRCYFIQGFPANYRERNKKIDKQGQEKRFAGAAQAESSGSKDIFNADQMAQILSLFKAVAGKEQTTTKDDFAGFAGSFYEEGNGDW